MKIVKIFIVIVLISIVSSEIKTNISPQGVITKQNNQVSSDGTITKYKTTITPQGIITKETTIIKPDGTIIKQTMIINAEGIVTKQKMTITSDGIVTKQTNIESNKNVDQEKVDKKQKKVDKKQKEISQQNKINTQNQQKVNAYENLNPNKNANQKQKIVRRKKQSSTQKAVIKEQVKQKSDKQQKMNNAQQKEKKQKKANEQQPELNEQQTNYLIQQVLSYITKSGFKIFVNPGFLRQSVKIIIQKLLKISLTKSALKKIPVLGAAVGLGLGAWRFFKGQYGRAAMEVASGVAGAAGIGFAGSLAIDIGILAADVVEKLRKNKVIQ